MSRLAEFRHLEQQLALQMAELDKLKNDDGLKREIEFETKLRDLLAEYNFSLKNIVNLLDPQAATRGITKTSQAKPTRQARKVKIYRHPLTNEIVQTKGGNHAVLKQWKAEHGAAEVESWVEQ